MDEIFLRDYANNVAMAQDPTGIAAIQAQPGFEGYVPSFSVVDQPMVNQDLNLAPQEGPVMIPTLKEIATNVAKDRVRNYALQKIGSEGLKSKVLGKALDFVIPGNQFVGLASLASGLMGGPEINPIGALQNLNTQVQSSLFGRSKTMADYLAAKREQKAAQTLERQTQTAVADQERAMAQRVISGGQDRSIPDRNRGQVTSSPGFSSKERGKALHG
jgi:hypothetical protein